MNLLRTTVPFAIAGAIIALPAIAQAQTATPTAQSALVEVNDDVVVPVMNVTVDELEDLDVHDTAGKEIGEIEEVWGTSETAATAVSIDFDDAVVADGDDRVVPLENLTLDGLNIRVNLDSAALTALPKAND